MPNSLIIISAIASFFQSFWQDAPGRIFISTVVAYFLSYVMYSGYISWFAAGYGGLLLSQIGFNAIDFLSLIPMMFFLIVQSFMPLIKAVFKFLLFYFGLPTIVAALILSLKFNIFAGNQTVTVFGLVVWGIGIALDLFWEAQGRKDKKLQWFSVLISILGFVIISFTIPSGSNPSGAASSGGLKLPQLVVQIFWIIGEISSLFSVILFVTILFLVGMQLASVSVTEKLLSNISEINLKQHIQIPGAVRKSENLTAPEKKNCRLIFKSPVVPKPDIYTFVWNADRPAYLVASFNRNTALYLPPETTQTERGQMLLIANDLIYSLGIQGPKSVNKE